MGETRKAVTMIGLALLSTIILGVGGSSSTFSGSVSPTYDAPDDCEDTFIDDLKGYAAGISLKCHLSAINSNQEKTNFSVIPSQLTRKLTVVCRDSLAISRLEPRSFSTLTSLEELTIDGCLFEHFPALVFEGLERLKKLTINTARRHQSSNEATIIPSTSSFAIGIDALVGMPSLTHLDLSGNSLRSIPPSELCHLGSLKHLDLSKNQLGSLDDLGLTSSNCLSNLHHLDLSENEITSVSSDIYKRILPNIADLDISNNFVRHLHETNHVRKQTSCNLKTVNLSNNQISGIPSTLFRNCGAHLTTVKLANNSLSTLDEHLFSELSSLKTLDLSGNHLTSSQISKRLFKDLTGLTKLFLSHNDLTQFEESENVFIPMSESLKVLKLNHNNINKLANQTFMPLEQLTELDLSNNQISSIDKLTFSGLKSVKHLLLGHNNIDVIHEQSFKHCSRLLVLDLSHNALSSAPEALLSLDGIQTIDLSNNLINSVIGASFLKMANLWRLQLNNNKLSKVSVGLFKEMKSLQILDLSANKINKVEKGSLDSNQKLQAVRLDANELETIEGLFVNLHNLIWLNVSDNKISQFDYTFLPVNLRWLDISHNQIGELGNYFDLTSELHLTELDVSFNLLKQLGPHNIPDSIENLMVNDNQISQIVPYTFFKKTRLTKVDLTVNDLKTIDRNALRLSSDVTRFPDFYLTGNPIECDCEMVWLKSINSASTLQNYPIVKDIESIYCRLVYTRQQTFIPLVEARNEQFLCPYKTHCFALCQCCDFDACDCEMTCPDNCTCYHDAAWSKNIAECSSSGFHDLPDQLPMDATEVFLDGNIFPEIHSHTFIGRKNLQVLHLNNSGIHTIHNKSFNGLKSLTGLHLQENQLTILRGYEFEALANLRELYLDGNMIEYIHNSTFKFLRSLEVLHLHNNRIIDFPVWQLAFNPFLVSVKLAENLWSCNCEFAERFRSWMAVYSAKIYDADNISCVSNEASIGHVKISEIGLSTCVTLGSNGNKDHLRGRNQEGNDEMQENDHLPLLAATLSSFAIVLLLLLTTFIYRNTLRVWIHAKYGVRIGKDVESSNRSVGKGDGKIFDAFISYSPKDDIFAREILAAELENESVAAESSSSDDCVMPLPGRRVCLYHRDLPGANQFVADTILQATEASRRTILILSENFLKSEWSRYDYKSGLHQALRVGRKKLVVIMLGNIAPRDLDPDLRLYLKTSTVLNWGEKMFWEKLRYELPDTNGRDQHRNRPNSHSPNSTVVSSVDDNSNDHYYQQPRYAGSVYGSSTSSRFPPIAQQQQPLPPPPPTTTSSISPNQLYEQVPTYQLPNNLMQLNKSLLQNNSSSFIQQINNQPGGGIHHGNLGSQKNILIQGNIFPANAPNAQISSVLLGSQQIPIYGSCRLPSTVAANLVNNEGHHILDPSAKSIAAVHI